MPGPQAGCVRARVVSSPWVVIILITLAAAVVRSLPLTDHRLHPDEALYGSFMRLITSGHNPLLAGELVDKPPLGFYLGAVTMSLVGQTELGARLPALWAGWLIVPLTWALGRRLAGDRAGQLAALVVAASPLAILFSPTVFLDSLLAAWLTASLWQAAAGRPHSSALFFGLALASKQTALLSLPLLLAVWALANSAPWGQTCGRYVRHGLQFAAWLLLATIVANGLVVIWDGLRQPPIGVWDQGYGDNAPGRWVRSDEIWTRAVAWAQLTSLALGPTWVGLVALAPVAWRLARGPADPAAVRMLVLAGHVLANLGGYWLLAFNVWDRYLLPSTPLLAVLAGYGIAELRAHAPNLVLTALVLAPGAWWASQGRYPLGGDHGAYDGVNQAAAFLRTQPAGTVVYDHWLSWPWRFYLYEGPAYVAWMADPSALTRDLQAFGRTAPRFFVVPSWEADTEFRAATNQAGFTWTPVFTATRPDGSPSFWVIRLLPADDF